MKRFAMFLGGLLILPAFGEVAPVFYDEYDMEYVDADYADDAYYDDADVIEEEEFEETDKKSVKTPVKVSRQQVVSRNIANRSTASRVTPSNATSVASGRGKSTGNSSRAVAARTTTAVSPRTNASRTVSSRTATTSATRAAAARATGGATRTTTTRTGTVASSGVKSSSVARTSTNSSGSRISRAARTQNKVVTLSGNENIVGAQTGLYYNPNEKSEPTSLYNSNRASIRTSSTRRAPVLRASSMSGLSTETAAPVAKDTSEMDELAELTDYCKAQYMACMDNYCNVLDENQGRCSCSANLKNYAKSEAALKQATEDLQDVAQKIQYIGLSAREVETLFSQTEAELKMQSNVDTSQLKTSLDKVKEMIIDAKSGNVSTSSSGMSFDISGLLDFTIDSTGFDLSSFLGGLAGGNNNVSNQRGEELFKTATTRCKANVLRACTAQGVDASIITNAYDLEIDKECIAYEKSLNESNEQMTATVRNAQGVLQKARLMVAKSKNEYDMRGCINALDACMQDEFVCGSDYENCLDPSGRYIVNGEIVVGSQPGHAIDPELAANVSSVMTSDVCDINLYRTWDFPDSQCAGYDGTYTSAFQQNNAWGSGENDTLAKYIDATVVTGAAKKASINMSEYLQRKIGYVEGDKNFGMCVGVLNKCQDYTYTGKGTNVKYNQENEVVKQYLSRVLVQIKAKQDQVLSEYAESCITDVSSCLAQNGYPTEEPQDEYGTEQWTGTEQTQANIAINACRATIVTCMSVNGYSIATPTPSEMNCWVMGLQFNTATAECATNGSGITPTPGGNGGGNGGDTSQYTVSFSCGQGSGSVSSQTTTNGSVTLPKFGCTTPANCTFVGWDCPGSSNYLPYSTSYSPSSDAQCVAHYNCGGSTTTSYTITYKCGSVATGSDWTKQVTGTSSSVSVTWDSASSVNTHCSYTNYTASNWNCAREGYTSGTNQNFGQSTTIRSNVTCTVVWTPNAGNTECSPSNRQYCDESNCATTGQGAWCYASSTDQDKSCVASESSCKCHAQDLGRCTGSTCAALGNNYHYCATGTNKAGCSTSGGGCCYTTTTRPSACNNETICRLVGNSWCASSSTCLPAGQNCISGGDTPVMSTSPQWSSAIETDENSSISAVVGAI
ncbi:MAG: hypothetical protein IKS08_01745 [Alphaproteobacteria bacterium]|nr:hypothetical protein [Alphaproteobacteria bacterium]